jgi:hypothetical protein
MHFTRDDLVQDLVMWGYPKQAEQAAQELPENFYGVLLAAWCHRIGLSKDQTSSRIGGSPDAGWQFTYADSTILGGHSTGPTFARRSYILGFVPNKVQPCVTVAT